MSVNVAQGVVLGGYAIDRFSGFRGVVTAKTHYVSGLVRCEVSPLVGNSNKFNPPVWFDEKRLDRLEFGQE